MKYFALIITTALIELSSSYAQVPSTELTNLSGKIMDKRTHATVNATIDIFCDNDFVTAVPEITSHGEFKASLQSYGWYIITISAPGYLTSTDTLWLMNEKRKSIGRSFYLSPLEVGLTVTINNIYFGFGNAELSEQSFLELTKVVDFFKNNPGVDFEISGHTDRSGPADYNLVLSQSRAEAVVEYLVSQGVERSQLVAKGYGLSKPIDVTGTRHGESRNRRVEFKVLNLQLSGN